MPSLLFFRPPAIPSAVCSFSFMVDSPITKGVTEDDDDNDDAWLAKPERGDCDLRVDGPSEERSELCYAFTTKSTLRYA